jgi:hypothetical protein
MNSLQAARPVAPIAIGIPAEKLIKTALGAAVSVSDLFIGSGKEAPNDGSRCPLSELRRNGLLTYAASVGATTAAATATTAATLLQVFAPINMATPFDWSVSLTNPSYWLNAAQLGASTWGVGAAQLVGYPAGVLIGAARSQAAKVRELVEDVAEKVGEMEEAAAKNKPAEPANKPAEPAKKPAEPTNKPAEPASKPAEPANKPAEPAKKPAEPAKKPSEPTRR